MYFIFYYLITRIVYLVFRAVQKVYHQGCHCQGKCQGNWKCQGKKAKCQGKFWKSWKSGNFCKMSGKFVDIHVILNFYL